MLSSFTSWLSGGSNATQGETEARENKTTSEKSTETSNQSQSAAGAAGPSWAGEPLLTLSLCVIRRRTYRLDIQRHWVCLYHQRDCHRNGQDKSKLNFY